MENANQDTFKQAAHDLRAKGYEVISPLENLTDNVQDWTFYLRRDIKLLMDCDHLVLLPGWSTSQGARLELEIASRLGFKISKISDLL